MIGGRCHASDMKEMFSEARAFNHPIGAWRVDQVKTMS